MGQEEKIAVIDLGTNTFHLLIGQIINGQINVIHKEKVPVKIGEGGIEEGIITDAALSRGIHTLQYFKEIVEEHGIKQLHATATSAFRNAKNQTSLKEAIKIKTGISINIIDGEEEAQLIYEGVQKAVTLTDEKSLIMDIGGGSVEFIICNKNEVFWKGSFEIGGQRLMSKFHAIDPISKNKQEELKEYLADQLYNLTEAYLKHNPTILIGASGSFDTLCEIYYTKNKPVFSLDQKTEYTLPFESFHSIVEDIISKDKSDRLKIPGMIEMRVNMIVVACLLIEFVVDSYKIKEIKSSTYALKEGLIFQKA